MQKDNVFKNFSASPLLSLQQENLLPSLTLYLWLSLIVFICYLGGLYYHSCFYNKCSLAAFPIWSCHHYRNGKKNSLSIQSLLSSNPQLLSYQQWSSVLITFATAFVFIVTITTFDQMNNYKYFHPLFYPHHFNSLYHLCCLLSYFQVCCYIIRNKFQDQVNI